MPVHSPLTSMMRLIASASMMVALASVLSPAALAQDPKRGGVWDDSIRPIGPKGNPKASGFDDSVRPIDPKANPKGGVWDDSVKPLDSKANPKGGVFDDSVKPKR